MPPIVAILASVVVLLVALAVILPARPADSREDSAPPVTTPEGSATDPEAAATLVRAQRLEKAREVWTFASRTHAQAKVALVLGATGIMGAGCAYAACRAALGQDWANAVVLLIVSIMLGWNGTLLWRRLQALRH